MAGRKRALKEMPALTGSIVAAGTYHDAWVSHPERLVLELILDGLELNKRSVAVNYTALTSCAGGVLTFMPEHGESIVVQPRLVMNAAGPWIDEVNATLGAPSKMIGGTKGSHILLRHDALVKELAGRMVYFEADDGRICLVYDYLGQALVGSTDIPADDPDTVQCEAGEIDYLLESLRGLFPGMSFGRDQITYVYSGIRPLPSSDASVPGLISRDHSAPVREPDGTRPFPIISLVGGKWTTFRGFAEEVADAVLSRLKRSREVTTRGMPIGGGKDFPLDAESGKRWLTDARGATDGGRLEELLSRYGSKALQIAKHESEWSDADRLPDSCSYSVAEMDFLVRNEHVVHLADIVMRRTTLAIGGTLTIDDLDKIAITAGRALDWDEQRRRAEVEAVVRDLSSLHRMQITSRR
jgi:glycerol-3-phosphate dehydrogenase